MATLPLRLRPVNHLMTLVSSLWLLGTTLATPDSHAFTYDVLVGSTIVQHVNVGTPLVWPELPIALRLDLGDAGRTLRTGTTSWDDQAASALVEWNALVPVFVPQATAANVVRWATPDERATMGLHVSVTRKEYGTRNGRFGVIQATVLLNPDYCWDAYDGPLRSGLCHGQWQVVSDLQRTLLHELGHVLGLEHPDDGGQAVSAVMNHVLSDLDTLTPDDQAGIHFLYPPAAQAQAAETRVVTGAAQSAGGGGGGCTLGDGQAPDVVLFWLPWVVLIVAIWHAVQRDLDRKRRRS